MGTVNGYLLDTHTFLWAVQEEHKLGKAGHEIIENAESALYLSSISAFEIANKYRIGKLPDYSYITENYHEIVKKFGAIELPVTAKQAYFAAKFEWEHRDPFDRILAAQASLEKLILISNDAAFETLSWVERLW